MCRSTWDLEASKRDVFGVENAGDLKKFPAGFCPQGWKNGGK